MRKAIRIVLGAALVLCTGFALALSLNGFPFRLMDFNGDGVLSPAEMLMSFDFGMRRVEITGQRCAEVFALKDGLPFRELCPG